MTKRFSGTQAQLDDIALNVFGIPATDTKRYVLEVMMNETATPYLFNGSQYTIVEHRYSNLYRTQLASSYHDNFLEKYKDMNNGVWSAWKDKPKTDKIDILSTNLKNGYGFAGGSNTMSRNGNSVTINTILLVGTITNNTVIMTMPTGFIPSLTQSFTCLWYSDPVAFQVGKLSVLPTTGDMVIFGAPSTKHNFVLISATYNL